MFHVQAEAFASPARASVFVWRLVVRATVRARDESGINSETVSCRARLSAALQGTHSRAPGSLGPRQMRQPFFDVRPVESIRRSGKVIAQFTVLVPGSVVMTTSL